MKLFSDSFIWGYLPIGIRPSLVWGSLLPSLEREIALPGEYEVFLGMDRTRGSGGGETFKIAPNDLAGLLERSNENVMLNVVKLGASGRRSQFFMYSVTHGSFTIYFDKSEVRGDVDVIVRNLFDELGMVNCICTRKDYVFSQRAHRKAGNNTDLFLAPAEKNYRSGYLEGVSAEMWLGEEFWQFAACQKLDVFCVDGIMAEDRATHVHLLSWPQQFDSSDGEQGEVQRNLLSLLFGRRKAD